MIFFVPIVSKCEEPVTVRAAPQNLSFIKEISSSMTGMNPQLTGWQHG
jgi:hypothetical protein